MKTHKPKRLPRRDDRDSASKRGYDRRWRRLRIAVLSGEPLCRECGKPATEVDHIVAIAKGGEDVESNLQPLCKPCHSRKTATQDGGLGR